MIPTQDAADPKEIRGWLVYDWAASAFTTTVATALLGPYVTALAQGAAGDNTALFGLGPLGSVTAKSFFPFCVSASVLLQVLFLPLLGALADYSDLKKKLMAGFCFGGAAATCLLFFVAGDLYWLGGLLFILANLGFGGASVLYNAFLPEIAPPEKSDGVSSRGFALGYLGGGLLLGLNLALILGAGRIGISQALAVRLSLLSAGLWWGGFALFTFTRLKSRPALRPKPAGRSYFRLAFSELLETFRRLRRLPQTLRYLAAYLVYNDGIQTVISLATVFLEQELFISRGLGPQPAFLLKLLLMVQFVAFLGSLAFERLARFFGTKRTILLSLLLWSGVVIYAYKFLETVPQAWGLAAAIALVLGGSQALSRSLYSRMIPSGFEASFFSLYEVSERGTSWIGPLIFGVVVAYTNSYRQALLSLIVLFVAGLLVLLVTDTDKASREAGRMGGKD